MTRLKRTLSYIGALALVLLAMDLFHPQHWIARAATTLQIFSSPALNVLEAYRQPFEQIQSVTCGGGECVSTAPAIVVPAAHRLVIERVSVSMALSSNVLGAYATLLTSRGHTNIPLTQIVGGLSPVQWIANSEAKAVFDPNGLPPSLSITGYPSGSLTGSSSGQVTYYGYVENCSAYPGGVCPQLTGLLPSN